MARLKKEKPNRADGLFEIKATIKHPDGSKKRRSFYSDISLDDARNKALEYQTEIIVAGRLGLGATDNDILFNDWCVKYLKSYKMGKISDSTYYSMEKRYEKYIKPYFKNYYIKNIKAIDIQNYFDSVSVRDTSSSVKEKIKFILNGAFETAIDNDIINKNPIRKLVLPEYKKVFEKKIYTEQEQQYILDYIKSNDCDKGIGIMLKTGIRRGELLALEWTDIDFDNLTITINKAVKDTSGKPFIGPPKSKAGNRTIIFDNELKEILLSINRTLTFTRNRIPIEIESKLVIPNKFGKLYSPANWVKRVYKPLLEQIAKCYKEKDNIELPTLNPHELRHSFGTTLYNKSVDLRTIQKIMGHATLEITSSLYVHDNIETMRKALKYSE